MFKRISRCHSSEFFPLLSSERATACGKKDFLNLIFGLSHKGLENSTVLTVYRENLYFLLLCKRHDNMSRTNKSLLVRKSYVLSAFNRLYSRSYSDHSDNRSKNGICFGNRDHLKKSVHSGHNLYTGIGYFLLKLFCRFRIKHTNILWIKFPDLLLNFINSLVCRKSHNFKLIFIISDNIKCLCSNGSRRSK